MEIVHSEGDLLSQPLASASADVTAAKLDALKDRIPIIWKGKAKEDATSSKAAQAPETTEKQQTPEPKPLQRLKPNAAFLLNVVADAQRGNERLCADEATNASLTVLGQVCSESCPSIATASEKRGDPARLVLLQQQQKLARWPETAMQVVFCIAGSQCGDKASAGQIPGSWGQCATRCSAVSSAAAEIGDLHRAAQGGSHGAWLCATHRP